MVNQPCYPAHIASLKPYVPGKPIGELARRLGVPTNQVAKLASNENPFGFSSLVREALKSGEVDLSRYPDNDCADLTRALASHHDLPPEWIVLGAGSESVIGNAVATFLEIGRRTAYSRYSFQAYVNSAQRVGAIPIVVDSPNFVVDLTGLRAQLVQEPSLIYIANPGNPTGTCVDPHELEDFLRAVPAHIVVLLDEAYFEFMPETVRLDSLRLVRTLSNLLVTRTFSKAYGLAGLRVGYGIAQPGMADMLRRARPPFTVTEQAQVAAMAALQDRDFIQRTVASNDAVRDHLAHDLGVLGFRSLRSHTNFLLAEVGDGSAWARRLESHGLIVRPVNSYGLARWLRISIGTSADIDRLVAAMRQEVA